MSSVIRRYLGWELLQYWLSFTLVLWLVLITARFSLYLGQAASGELPATTVLTLLGLKSVGFFVLLLPLTLFLALLWLLGRLNRDHETLALGASGLGPLQLYRVLALPLLLALALVTLLSFYLVPRSAHSGYQLRADSQQVIETQALIPGRFHSLRNGRWLLYAQRGGQAEGELEDVFVHMQQAGRAQVLVAQRALVRGTLAAGNRYVILRDGYRYDGVPGQADYRVLQYTEYALRLQSHQTEPEPEQKWDAVASADLWNRDSPEAQAEWQARLSRPLSMLILFLMAVPLARFRPATSRFYPLWLGVLVFTLYFNLLATAKLWLAQGRSPDWLGLWWVHTLFLIGWLVWLSPRPRWLYRHTT
ncbi:Lipopolysaccharide export system permease protein LptF [hydrothermal vent metagenome]|uniref:Lipopolysaccharide export system permease protein LptF n=1 Tax=hydrothermal vent metagenome TaxID=652676 RepID=A0A3B0YWR9_9ZZZZ